MRRIVELLRFEDFLLPISKTYQQRRGGFNSEILHIHEENGGRKIIKRIGGKRGGFEISRAEEIAHDIMVYQNKLIDLGIPMPSIEKVSIEYELPKRHASVLMTTKWTGFDAEMFIDKWSLVFDNDLQLMNKLVKDMCSILGCVSKSRISGWETEFGIDPKPSNFTVDNNGILWYVDPFPPRYRKNGKPIIEWFDLKTETGEKIGYFKYFDMRGVILGLIEQLSRIKPQLKDFFENTILSAFGFLNIVSKEEYTCFLMELAKAPWNDFREAIYKNFEGKNSNRAKEIIKESSEIELFGVNCGVYVLRRIALELTYCGRMFPLEMESFFKKSHFEDEISDSKLKSLQEILCAYV